MRKFTFFLGSAILASFSFFADAQEAPDYSRFDLTTEKTFTVGTPSSENYASSWHPICTKKASSGMERVYKKNELGNPLDDLKINSMRLYTKDTKSSGSYPVKVYLANTDANPSPATMTSFAPESEYTKVFDGNVTFATTTTEITFIEPFIYDHTKNLRMLISVDGAPGVSFWGDISSTAQATFIQYYSDASGATAFNAPSAPSAMDEYNSGGYTLRCNKTNNLQTTWVYNEAKQPVLTVTSTDFTGDWNAGEVAVGTPTTVTFNVKGDALTDDITISSSCSEVVASPATLSKDAVMSENGVDVTLTLNVNAEASANASAITLAMGDKTMSSFNVNWTVAPVIVPSVTANPTEWAAGNVYNNATATKEFTLTGENNVNNVTITLSNGEGYSLYFGEDQSEVTKTVTASELNAEGGYKFTATLKPTAIAENGTATITVSSANGDFSDVVIPVTYTAIERPTLTVSPTSKNLGEVAKGSTAETSFQVTFSNLLEDVTISAPEHVTLDRTTIAKDAESPVTLKATINCPENGDFTDSFTLTSKDVESTVNLSWNVVDAEFSVDNATLDFGEVKIENDKTMSVTLTAKALAGNVTVSSPTSSAVKVSTTSISKESANGTVINVTVAPTELDTNSDSFTLSAEGFEPITVNVNWTPLPADESHTIGSYGSDTSAYPVRTDWNNSTCETVYSNSDLTSESGILTGMAFPHAYNIWYSGGSKDDTKHFTIWVGNTADTYVGSSFTDVNGLTQVFDGDVKINKEGGFSLEDASWLKFVFDQEYKLERGKNLRVVIRATGNGNSNVVFLTDTSRRQSYLVACSNTESELAAAVPYNYVNSSYAITKFYFGPKVYNPEITVSEESWNAGEITVSQSTSKTFTITGVDLTDDIQISNTCAAVTVSPSLIPAAQAEIGSQVTVTITPVNETDNSDQIVITSGDITKTISVTWTALPFSGIEGITFDVPTEVAIFDIQGRCIKSEVVCGSIKETLNALNQGVYVIKANNKVYKVRVK